MVIIHSTDPAMERRALGYLAGRFSFKTWDTGETAVPPQALASLAMEGISFTVEDRATYEPGHQMISRINGADAWFSWLCSGASAHPPFIQSGTLQVSSPLDKLDAQEIDEADRKSLAIPELVGYLRPHLRAVASVAISPDGSLLASSGWDNTVHIYKLGGKEPMSWAKLDGSPSGVAFSPDGKLLATGCGDTPSFSGT